VPVAVELAGAHKAQDRGQVAAGGALRCVLDVAVTEGRVESLNPLARATSALAMKTVDRRTFLKGAGLGAGAAAFASALPLNMIGEAQAQTRKTGKTEIKRTVCTHCSVGCAIDAVVTDGVWVRQEPGRRGRGSPGPSSGKAWSYGGRYA
jgi:hypothetical protein